MGRWTSAGRSGDLSREERRERAEALRAEICAGVEAVLTPGQREQVEARHAEREARRAEPSGPTVMPDETLTPEQREAVEVHRALATLTLRKPRGHAQTGS